MIYTDNAPIPRGHYSQAVVANGLVFVAGQLPIVPGAQGLIPEGIVEQIEQVFKNLQAILQAAGSELDKLVSVQIFIPKIALWASVDDAYKRILGPHKPARTVVPCGPLRDGALIELNAVAMKSERNTKGTYYGRPSAGRRGSLASREKRASLPPRKNRHHR